MWWHDSKPEQIKPVCWLHTDVVSFLDSIVKPDFEVLEHGSGGSTLWLADRCKRVVSFETNMEWKRRIDSFEKSNVYVILGNFVPNVLGFGLFDLVMIDGLPVKMREDWARVAPTLVKPNGWIMLDNANKEQYAGQRKVLQSIAKEVKTFDGNSGGTEYLVTEFYRL